MTLGQDRFTSIKQVLEKDISFKTAAQAMKKGFEEEFNVKLVEGTLTEEEIELTKKFEKEYFGARDWNYRR